MEVFPKVLEPFVEVATFDPNSKHIHNFDIESFVMKCLRRLFDCE